MLEVTKRFRIRCGHKLSGLKEGHKCSNPHGEFYTIDVKLRTTKSAKELDKNMLVDFADIKACVNSVIDSYDHAFLICSKDPDLKDWVAMQAKGYNVKILQDNPTVESLAELFFNQIKKTAIGDYLYKIKVCESYDNWASYSETEL